jgi:hypothetical protein
MFDKNLELVWPGYRGRSSAPSEDLVKWINAIDQTDVRKEALSILYDNDEFHGLGVTVSLASFLFKMRRPSPKGPSALADEFKKIAQTMTTLSKSLNRLSPTAKEFIKFMPGFEMANDECRKQISLWDLSNASEAFASPFHGDEQEPVLAERLDLMAEMLKSFEKESRNTGKANPGRKTVFPPAPSDLDLFDSVACVLVNRGKALTHLRPIVISLYAFITNEWKVDDWGDRQERAARKQFCTRPS